MQMQQLAFRPALNRGRPSPWRIFLLAMSGAAFLGTSLLSAQETLDAKTAGLGAAPAAEVAAGPPPSWNLHFQNTDILQGNAAFPASYSGPNSLSNNGQIRETVTADIFAGFRLWSGAELHVDGLMWQGFGLSDTHGIEAFPNGDAFKAGTEIPNYNVARLFLRQTIGLGGDQEDIADDLLNLAGKRDVSRLTITLGRFSPLDVFDNNSYAIDPRSQFMNWAMMGNLAWDYGQDTVGFTTGLSVELNQPEWALRYGFFQMPALKNGYTLEDRFLKWPSEGEDGPFLKSWSMMVEFERRYHWGKHPGSVRLLTWLNEADMASYNAATALLRAEGPQANLDAARAYRHKYGFGVNWEQELASNLGAFSRLGWNDGQEEAWTYSDVNWTASMGLSLKGEAYGRPGDTIGLVFAIDGASAAAQRFLVAGGQDLLDGDGALNYRPEKALELYYSFEVTRYFHFTLDYQFVADPAFNADRGPVSVFGIRAHFQF